jgi:hypothetical protein
MGWDGVEWSGVEWNGMECNAMHPHTNPYLVDLQMSIKARADANQGIGVVHFLTDLAPQLRLHLWVLNYELFVLQRGIEFDV